MHFFNYVFTPFGIILVLFAVIFSNLPQKDTIISVITLFVQFSINYYVFKNLYHLKNPIKTRFLLIFFNILTTSVVFYFITAYWASSWLLFTMPAIFGATFLDFKKTLLVSVVSSFMMSFVYWFRAYIILDSELSINFVAIILTQALFIIATAVFVNNISQTMIKLRTTK